MPLSHPPIYKKKRSKLWLENFTNQHIHDFNKKILILVKPSNCANEGENVQSAQTILIKESP